MLRWLKRWFAGRYAGDFMRKLIEEDLERVRQNVPLGELIGIARYLAQGRAFVEHTFKNEGSEAGLNAARATAQRATRDRHEEIAHGSQSFDGPWLKASLLESWAGAKTGSKIGKISVQAFRRIDALILKFLIDTLGQDEVNDLAQNGPTMLNHDPNLSRDKPILPNGSEFAGENENPKISSGTPPDSNGIVIKPPKDLAVTAAQEVDFDQFPLSNDQEERAKQHWRQAARFRQMAMETDHEGDRARHLQTAKMADWLAKRIENRTVEQDILGTAKVRGHITYDELTSFIHEAVAV